MLGGLMESAMVGLIGLIVWPSVRERGPGRSRRMLYDYIVNTPCARLYDIV